MFEHLRGRLERKTPAEAVIDVGGVGYLLSIPLSTYERLPAEGSDARFLVEFVVREDAHRLFGFATREERSFFRMLQSVSGVGPSVALQIVSSASFGEVRDAVLAADAARLRRIRGVGKKLSERLVVELRDSMEAAAPGMAATSSGDPIARDAVLALEALGFPRAAAEQALSDCSGETPPPRDAGELVRRALRRL